MLQRRRYSGASPPLESFKNVLHIEDGFWGPAGKQVVELVSQKCTQDLAGSRDICICPGERGLEALGFRSPLTGL